MNVDELTTKVEQCNNEVNEILTKAMKDKYDDDERDRMRMELQLVDPKYLDGATERILHHYGTVAVGKLLDLYGKEHVVDNRLFRPLIDRKKCLEEYNEWKVFAARETENWIGLPQYDRIMAMYKMTASKFGSDYLNWCKLYRIILLNWSSSMSLERLFSARKKYQPATCSNYSYQGLSDRLVLHHNSAKPGTFRSVILYMKAMQKWFNMKQKRIYSDPSPFDDYRLQK